MDNPKKVPPVDQLLTMDILENILKYADNPTDLGEFLAKQATEIIGGRIAILLQCEHFANDPFHKTISVYPKQQNKISGKPEIEKLAKLSHDINEAVCWQSVNSSNEIAENLKRLEFHSTVVVPLSVGKERIGLFVILDLKKDFVEDIVLKTMDRLSSVSALVLRNALIYKNLESLVEERTQKLTRSENKYRTIFENVQDVFYQADFDGNILDISPSIKRYSGYSREELIGIPITNIYFQPDDREKLLKAIQDKGEVNDYELRLRTSNNQVVYTSVNAHIFYDGNEKPAGVEGSLRDITERKLAEEALLSSEKQYRELQENVPVGMYRSTTRGIFISVNSALVKILGFDSKKELLKTTLEEIFLNKADRINLMAHINKHGFVVGHEVQLLKKDMSDIWVSISARIVTDTKSRIKFYDGIVEDITIRKKARQELVSAKEKAEESDRIKTTFLATISHELRTPLNAIIGFSEIIEEGLPEDDTVEFARTINSSGHHLLGMIEEILDISLLGSKEIKTYKESFSLNEVMLDLYRFTETEKKRKNKENLDLLCPSLNKNLEVQVVTDRSKLKHIFTILLKNAVKFTSGGFIEFGFDVENENEIVFHVKDSGIGISKEKHQIIFEYFRQADDSDTRLYGGLGIGLSIARQLVELLNGNIWVESDKGKGSIFIFRIKMDKISITEGIHKHTVDQLNNIDFSGKTILIAEDEMSNYLLYESMLEKTGIDIIWAKDGEEAVNLCDSNKKIDLIFMDLRMPKMDGLTAVKKIQAIKPNIPIVVQTAYSIPEKKKLESTLGVSSILLKPISQSVFLKTVNQYLQ